MTGDDDNPAFLSRSSAFCITLDAFVRLETCSSSLSSSPRSHHIYISSSQTKQPSSPNKATGTRQNVHKGGRTSPSSHSLPIHSFHPLPQTASGSSHKTNLFLPGRSVTDSFPSTPGARREQLHHRALFTLFIWLARPPPLLFLPSFSFLLVLLLHTAVVPTFRSLWGPRPSEADNHAPSLLNRPRLKVHAKAFVYLTHLYTTHNSRLLFTQGEH
ncbi:hypothetical protein LZ31DRAFT_46868 [Colletotrichum somersetense]|nr:hypothetical protein LZ31DRAFT_46868 [Colletotrichum somersetense]